MKDSKKYSKKTDKLFKSLKQGNASVKTKTFNSTIDALVYAAISEHVRSTKVSSIIKQIREHFIDYNDLRVSRTEEIIDTIDVPLKNAKKIAKSLPSSLNAVFNRFNRSSLEELFEMGKRQAKKELDEMEGISKFAASYCFLTALGGHSIPLTQKMLDYLRANDYVHPDSEDSDIYGFIERQVPASDAYTFYYLLRKESEATKNTKEKTRKTKTKTKTKTKKKKTTK